MMDITLAGLSPSRVLAYMDDVIIFDKTFGSHLISIESVLERFKGANISLKASKCEFAMKNVEF